MTSDKYKEAHKMINWKLGGVLIKNTKLIFVTCRLIKNYKKQNQKLNYRICSSSIYVWSFICCWMIITIIIIISSGSISRLWRSCIIHCGQLHLLKVLSFCCEHVMMMCSVLGSGGICRWRLNNFSWWQSATVRYLIGVLWLMNVNTRTWWRLLRTHRWPLLLLMMMMMLADILPLRRIGCDRRFLVNWSFIRQQVNVLRLNVSPSRRLLNV